MLLARSSRPAPRSGAILAWVALSLAVILGIVALNLDGGRLLEERRRAQTVADAAALTAAADLYANYWGHHGLDPNGTAGAAAEAAAVANGYPAGAVTVNVPPQSGTFAGQAGHVEVVLRTSVGATFGTLFTDQDLPVSARAVARGRPMKLGLILMRPSGANAFHNKAAAFTLVNSPVIVNSGDLTAFHQSGAGVIIASRYDVTGGFVNSGGALVVGKVRTGVRPTPDPLWFLPVPDGAAVRSGAPLKIDSPLPTILQPGVYRGGLRVTGAAVVTLLPGVYIMEGGGFQVDGAATVVGLEVLIYNTTSDAYATGSIAVASTGKVALAAPLAGTYQGINFFQNRSLAEPVSLTGFGLTAITGVVYALKAPVTLTGSAAVGADILGGAYVVDSMTVGGAGAINVNLGLNPPRVPEVHLVD
jgi:hypothetical protein